MNVMSNNPLTGFLQKQTTTPFYSNAEERLKQKRSHSPSMDMARHRFILPLPPPFRMVKKNYFQVTQIKFQKWIWLLKFDTPSNQTESVLFQTKNGMSDPEMGAYRTPEFGCFFKIFKMQLFCCFITQLVKKLHQ